MHQRILLYNNLITVQAITKFLYNKVLKPTLLFVLQSKQQCLLDNIANADTLGLDEGLYPNVRKDQRRILCDS